jgi:SNF2 family DNA or RNA helicase
MKVSRIDGQTKERDRQRFVDEFNDPESDVEVMLLSTKAGGLGLTLTGADRAIIYDPSFNPAEDSQAVDRCYRIGQKRDVKVFRFIAAGTVEEKMLEKQVHKDGIRRAVMTSMGNDTARYFDKKDLKRLFTLAPEGECALLAKVQSTDNESGLGSHQKPSFLGSHPGVIGISSYDDIYRQRDKPISLLSPEPFGGKTPKVQGRSQRALARTKMSSPLDFGKENIPAQQFSSIDLSQDEMHGSRKQQEKSSEVETDLSTEDKQKIVEQGEAIAIILHRAKLLRANGKLKDTLELLLETAETRGDLRGREKFLLHEQIAQIGDDLGYALML